MFPQLSFSDPFQIWKWFKGCNNYFYQIKNPPYRNSNKWSFSTPTTTRTQYPHPTPHSQPLLTPTHPTCMASEFHCYDNYCYSIEYIMIMKCFDNYWPFVMEIHLFWFMFLMCQRLGIHALNLMLIWLILILQIWTQTFASSISQPSTYHFRDNKLLGIWGIEHKMVQSTDLLFFHKMFIIIGITYMAFKKPCIATWPMKHSSELHIYQLNHHKSFLFSLASPLWKLLPQEWPLQYLFCDKWKLPCWSLIVLSAQDPRTFVCN